MQKKADELKQKTANTPKEAKAVKSGKMSKSTFINADLLYQQIDALLGDLNADILMAGCSIDKKPRCGYDCIPQEIQDNIRSSIRRYKEARDKIQKIRDTFTAFKQQHSKRSKAKVQKESKLIEHLTVITGDLYHPPRLNPSQDILSDTFKEFLKKQENVEVRS